MEIAVRRQLHEFDQKGSHRLHHPVLRSSQPCQCHLLDRPTAKVDLLLPDSRLGPAKRLVQDLPDRVSVYAQKLGDPIKE